MNTEERMRQLAAEMQKQTSAIRSEIEAMEVEARTLESCAARILARLPGGDATK